MKRLIDDMALITRKFKSTSTKMPKLKGMSQRTLKEMNWYASSVRSMTHHKGQLKRSLDM